MAALTNPTELARRRGNLTCSYPVMDKTGRMWSELQSALRSGYTLAVPDSEAAYKAFKTGDRRKSPWGVTARDERVMVRIIAAKLKQHPNLVTAVGKRGGVAFLESCSHLIGVKGSRREGRGLESRFIHCLVAAYRLAGKGAR